MMPYQMTIRRLILLLLPLALLLPLHWSAMMSRSRQFSEAVNNRNLTTATELKKKGIRRDLEVELRFQILKGNIPGVRSLIAEGADVNFQDETWSSPLCFAAAIGSVPITKLLITHGANVDLKDNLEYHGTNALITAASYHRYGVVKTLINYQANVNAKTAMGSTALDAARQAEAFDYNLQVRTIQILKEGGAVAATSWPLSFEKQARK